MSGFQPEVEPATVWLTGLIEALDEVAASSAKASAADRKALANRLELPALPAPFAALIDPAIPRPVDQAGRRRRQSLLTQSFDGAHRG